MLLARAEGKEELDSNLSWDGEVGLFAAGWLVSNARVSPLGLQTKE